MDNAIHLSYNRPHIIYLLRKKKNVLVPMHSCNSSPRNLDKFTEAKIAVDNLKFGGSFCFILFYLAFATRAGSPQQREPITVGPYYLSPPVNFPCGRKPEYPEKTHDFRQSVDYSSIPSKVDYFESTLLGIELGTSEVKGEWSDHYTTEATVFVAGK